MKLDFMRDICAPIGGISILAFFIWVCFYVRDTDKQMKAEREAFCAGKTVVEIGGCDRGLGCSVRLSSGEKTKMYMPLVGDPCK